MTSSTKPGHPVPVPDDILDREPTTGEEIHVHPEQALRVLMADLQHRIQVAAYFLAERRGFAPGHELDDWLAAESAIDAEDAARASED